VRSSRELYRALLPGGVFILIMTGASYLVGALTNVYFWQRHGKTALDVVTDPATGVTNVDKIIPTFINQAMPEWFGYHFMLTLLAAAMSTLSGQFHAIGTSIGRDIYQQGLARGRHEQRTVPLAKLGILIAFVLTVVLAYNLGVGVIAIATALFFGMSAAVFLPAYTAALFWPRATKAGAIAGMLVGLVVWGAWVLFFHEKESAALGLCLALFGKSSLVAGSMWRVVDPIILALPASSLTTIAVSLIERRAQR
jgi:SSS family solute:Na+ symporter